MLWQISSPSEWRRISSVWGRELPTVRLRSPELTVSPGNIKPSWWTLVTVFPSLWGLTILRRYQVKWWERCYKTSYQIRTCNSVDLVCVESLPAVNTEDCLELCEGTIVDVTKLASVREETVMDSFIREYELYKHLHSNNLRQGKIIEENSYLDRLQNT